MIEENTIGAGENINGWSRYQMMVLAQLEAHTRLLENLMNDISEIKQKIAISENNNTNWRENSDAKIKNLQEDVRFILEDDNGINHRLYEIENSKKAEEKITLKFKAYWGFIGGAAVIIFDILIKAFDFIIHNNLIK